MKRATKVGLSIFAVLIVVIAVVFICADVWVSKLVNNRIQGALENTAPYKVSVGPVHVHFFSRIVTVRDIYFSTDTLSRDTLPKNKKDRIPGVQIRVPHVTIGPVSYVRMLREKNLSFYSLYVSEPEIIYYYAPIPKPLPQRAVTQKSAPADTIKQDTATIATVKRFIERVNLHHLRVKNASLRYYDLSSRLSMRVDSASIGLNNLGYCLLDSSYTYNDSVYDVEVGAFYITLPDGLSRAEVHAIHYEDDGPIQIGYTRYANTIGKAALADLKKIPVTWVDAQVNSIQTAPKPLRAFLNEDYAIPSVNVDVRRVDLYRDVRYKPVKPYPMPQEAILGTQASIHIGKVDLNVRKLNVEYALTLENVGKLTIDKLKGTITNISNRRDDVMKAAVEGKIGEKGKLGIAINFIMNDDAVWNCSLNASDFEVSALNPFIQPMVGISMNCHVDELKTQFKGDKIAAEGEFMMLYNDFSLKVHKEQNIPIKILKNNAGFINSVANNLLPKSNPSSERKAPRAYRVKAKRDEWKPFPLFMFGPVINGAVKTLLPGLFLSDKIKVPKDDTTQSPFKEKKK